MQTLQEAWSRNEQCWFATCSGEIERNSSAGKTADYRVLWTFASPFRPRSIAWRLSLSRPAKLIRLRSFRPCCGSTTVRCRNISLANGNETWWPTMFASTRSRGEKRHRHFTTRIWMNCSNSFEYLQFILLQNLKTAIQELFFIAVGNLWNMGWWSF